MEVPMDRRSSISIPRSIQLAKSLAKPLFKRLRFRARRALAPPLLVFVLSSVAQAQGTMDFSGAQTLMGTFKTFAVYAGAVICFGGLIFAGIRMMSGRFQDAIPGLFGALFGAGVLGWGAGWIGVASQSAGTGAFGLLSRGLERFERPQSEAHPSARAELAVLDRAERLALPQRCPVRQARRASRRHRGQLRRLPQADGP
jgi:hypothetical protein